MPPAAEPTPYRILALIASKLAITAGSDYWFTIPAASVLWGEHDPAQLPSGPVAIISAESEEVVSRGPGVALTERQHSLSVRMYARAPFERASGETEQKAALRAGMRLAQDVRTAVLANWDNPSTGFASVGVDLVSEEASVVSRSGIAQGIAGMAECEIAITCTYRESI